MIFLAANILNEWTDYFPIALLSYTLLPTFSDPQIAIGHDHLGKDFFKTITIILIGGVSYSKT